MNELRRRPPEIRVQSAGDSTVVTVTSAAPASVTELRRQAAEFAQRAGAAPRVVDDVALAVSEAVTNVVRHGYEADDEIGTVKLTLAAEDGWLDVTVCDRGHGFRSGNSPGLGLGLPIIAEVSAVLEISQGTSGTELLMRFPLSTA